MGFVYSVGLQKSTYSLTSFSDFGIGYAQRSNNGLLTGIYAVAGRGVVHVWRATESLAARLSAWIHEQFPLTPRRGLAAAWADPAPASAASAAVAVHIGLVAATGGASNVHGRRVACGGRGD
jgi:hypothetical protein